MLLSQRGAHFPHIAFMAGNVTPYKTQVCIHITQNMHVYLYLGVNIHIYYMCVTLDNNMFCIMLPLLFLLWLGEQWRRTDSTEQLEGSAGLGWPCTVHRVQTVSSHQKLLPATPQESEWWCSRRKMPLAPATGCWSPS